MPVERSRSADAGSAYPDQKDVSRSAGRRLRGSQRLTRAVERRLVNDVPLDAFLSGGVDSSSSG
jgi:asparagine synthetase B (glutamine-hydrolysing)